MAQKNRNRTLRGTVTPSDEGITGTHAKKRTDFMRSMRDCENDLSRSPHESDSRRLCRKKLQNLKGLRRVAVAKAVNLLSDRNDIAHRHQNGIVVQGSVFFYGVCKPGKGEQIEIDIALKKDFRLQF